MIALRTSTSLSALGLVIGIAGTSWLTALTYERAPAARPFAEVIMPGLSSKIASRPKAIPVPPAPPVVTTAPRVVQAPVAVRHVARAAPEALVPVYMPSPRYPIAALRAQREGRVVLSVTVTPEGDVTGVTVGRSSGDLDLDRAAEEAVRNWRFAAADNRAPRYTAELPVRFEITRPD